MSNDLISSATLAAIRAAATTPAVPGPVVPQREPAMPAPAAVSVLGEVNWAEILAQYAAALPREIPDPCPCQGCTALRASYRREWGIPLD